MEVNRIIQGDCVQEMRDLPDALVDLIITDPPYISSQNNTTQKDIHGRLDYKSLEEYLDWSYLWIMECARILKPEGSFYIFSGDGVFDLYPLLTDYFTLNSTISWIKKNRIVTTPQLRKYFPKTELVLFMTKDGKKYTWNKPVKKYGIMGSSNFQEYANIYRNMREGVEHPSQKPLGLIEKFIYTSSNEGDIVFDPFLGSGTTIVAADKMNRKWLGIELEEKYCQLAQKRLDDSRD